MDGQDIVFEVDWPMSLCDPIKIQVLITGEILVAGSAVEPISKTKEILFSPAKQPGLD